MSEKPPFKAKQDKLAYLAEFEEAATAETDEGISGGGDEKSSSEDFAALLNQSMGGATQNVNRRDARRAPPSQGTAATKRFSVGDKITGEILVIGREDVFVSVGPQKDGVLQRRELVDETGALTCKVGDKLPFYVTAIKGGEIRLSKNPTSKNLADDILAAFEAGQPIEGRVVEECKGGVRVSIKNKLAFCPISQLDRARIENAAEYVGQKFEFVVTQFSEGGRNIVVSRRKLLDEAQVLSEGSFLAEHKAGAIVPGKVKRLENYGAFIEVAPGLEGLAHISELSWSRVAHPSEALSVGQDVRAKILSIENPPEGRVKISLSVKQAGEQPWDHIPPQLAAGQIAEGKVTRCAKFGAFVELAPGLEGLVPLSEMSYTKRVLRAEEVVKEGEKITVMIKGIDPSTRRISLSIKDAGQDPWALIDQKFPVGMIVKGRIERREGYGLFVKLEDGVVGLLPKSKALEMPEFPFEKLRIGDEATVQVAEVKRDERRISLQPPKDPESDEWKKHVAAQSASASMGTLGGLFGAKLKGLVKPG